MIDIDEIVQHIAERYRYGYSEQSQVEIPLVQQAAQLDYRAKDYIEAASILEKHAPQNFLVVLQLCGQAIELSLKACLASANSAPPNGHDLVDLFRRVQQVGFQLDKSKVSRIVLLQHFYYADLATGTRYKSRYPTRKIEHVGGAVPTVSMFSEIAEALLGQAANRRKS